MPVRPKGANGCQLAGLTWKAPTTITNSTMVTLRITMPVFTPALSLIPMTSTMVTSTAMTIAGRSNHVPVPASLPVVRS